MIFASFCLLDFYYMRSIKLIERLIHSGNIMHYIKLIERSYSFVLKLKSIKIPTNHKTGNENKFTVLSFSLIKIYYCTLILKTYRKR